MKRRVSWIFTGLGFVTLGIAILAAPSRWEGPVLLPISPGHGLSVIDMFGVAPVLIGTGWLYYGLWQRRQRVFEQIRNSPYIGSLGVFAAGTGMGLLVASSFSAFFWWWAVGAVLFGTMLIVALKASV